MGVLQEVRRQFFLGVDLGKFRDPSCLAIIERQERHDVMGVPSLGAVSTQFSDRRYILRDLRRYKLGTSYVSVAEDLRHLMAT